MLESIQGKKIIEFSKNNKMWHWNCTIEKIMNKIQVELNIYIRILWLCDDDGNKSDDDDKNVLFIEKQIILWWW